MLLSLWVVLVVVCRVSLSVGVRCLLLDCVGTVCCYFLCVVYFVFVDGGCVLLLVV